MSELKSVKQSDVMWGHWFTEYYLKSDADKVIAELEESHKKEVGQLLMEIAELKAQKAQAEDDCAYWKMCHGNVENAMHSRRKRQLPTV